MAIEQASGTIEREMQMVGSAIGMVAGRHARRVTVAGLHFGQPLLAVADRMARDAGVRVVALWSSDDGGADIAVERDGED